MLDWLSFKDSKGRLQFPSVHVKLSNQPSTRSWKYRARIESDPLVTLSRERNSQQCDSDDFNNAIFAASLCGLLLSWTCGRVPHITLKRDNDVARPRTPIMFGSTSHSVMDGPPPPGLDSIRSNQSAILVTGVSSLFSLATLHRVLKPSKLNLQCARRQAL
jgi:hypothetical protein